MKTLCMTFLITLITTVTVSAQTARVKEASLSQIIEQVYIRGNRRISEADIKSWISTHKHDAYSPKKLDGDVRALFDTGHFVDVKVFVEDGPAGGKIITFELMDRPLILNVNFEGIDSSLLAEAKEEWHKQRIELAAGTEYDPRNIKRAAAIMQELLNQRQPDNLRVVPYAEQQTAVEVSITFKVEKSS